MKTILLLAISLALTPLGSIAEEPQPRGSAKKAAAEDTAANQVKEDAAFEARRAKWTKQAYAEYPELNDSDSPLRKEAERLLAEYKKIDHQNISGGGCDVTGTRGRCESRSGAQARRC